ncbi:hypothetical protein C8F01DRAFT_1102168, partial [Mycena amicta]
MKVKPHKSEYASNKDVAKQSNPHELQMWMNEAQRGYSRMVPVEVFLSNYMGVTGPTESVLEKMVDRSSFMLTQAATSVGKLETKMYEPFISYIDSAFTIFPKAMRPCFGLTWATLFPPLHETDHGSKPDIAGLKPGLKKKLDEEWIWRLICTIIEFKRNYDIFADDGRPLDGEEHLKDLVQLIHNARRIFMASGCCYVFLLSIFGDSARMLRVDHSGYIVSEKFDWTEEGTTTIPEFYWRIYYGEETEGERLRAQQGHFLGADSTVSIPTRFESQKMFNTLTKLGYKHWSFEEVGTGDERKRCFTVGPPIHQSKGLFSRVTHAWVQKCRLPEYLFYAIIKEHHGGSTPRGLTACIVGEDLSTRCAGHCTITASLREGGKELQERYHQRTVMEDVGTPLYEYPDTKTLVQVVQDALEGHQAAVNAGIVHRDVSVGNILIRQGPQRLEGFLHDWDVSILTDEGWEILLRVARAFNFSVESLEKLKLELNLKDLTGTFPFLALDVLEAHHRNIPFQHQAHHDIESFYWLLIWVLLRHAKHSLPDGPLACATFFDKERDSDAIAQKVNWLARTSMASIFPDNPTLSTLIDELRQVIYQGQKSLRLTTSVVPLTHERMISHFAAALAQDDWPRTDGAIPFDPPSLEAGAAAMHYRPLPISLPTHNQTRAAGDPASGAGYGDPFLAYHGAHVLNGLPRASERAIPASDRAGVGSYHSATGDKRKREPDDKDEGEPDEGGEEDEDEEG